MYSAIRPLLFKLDPETAHNVTFSTAGIAQQTPGMLAMLRHQYQFADPRLETKALGHHFPNPLGIAAGFDKNAKILPTIAALGFGFLEVGSVTNEPRQGNTRPRLFRLEKDKALINRMGLNNAGPEAIRRNIERFRQAATGPTGSPIVLGVNIAKTHDPDILGARAVEDIVSCFAKMQPVADFMVLNVSCPNTTEGKTFEDPEALTELLTAVEAKRKEASDAPPLLIKFSPDVSPFALEKSIEACEQFPVDGYVLVNTSNKRDDLATAESRLEKIGAGGLSGIPVRERAIERVRFVRKLLGKEKTLIGLGGIDSAESAYRFIRAGATLVEMYTGLVYQGPSVCQNILRGLLDLLERDGFSTISEAVASEGQH